MPQVETIIPLSGRAIIQFANFGSTVPGEDQTDLLNLTSADYATLLKSEITECTNTWKKATHYLQASSRDYVDGILAPFLEKKYAKIWFRFGIIAGDNTDWRAWEEHIIVSALTFPPVDVNTGPRVVIETVDLLWEFDKTSRVFAHQGAVSDIVLAMWQIHSGHKTLIEDTAQPTRSSDNSEAGVYYQSFYDSDFWMLYEKLLPRSRNKEGYAGYRFYVADGALHYHTVGYKMSTVKDIPFSIDISAVRNLTTADRLGEFGWLSSIAYSDPVTGFSNFYSADEGNVITLSDKSPVIDNINPASAWMGHVGPNLEIDEQTFAQATYSSLVSECYAVEFDLPSTVQVLVGDIINLNIATTSGKYSVYSGLWQVTRVITTIDNSSLMCKITATRGELNATEDKLVKDPDTLTYNTRQSKKLNVLSKAQSDGPSTTSSSNKVVTQNSVFVVIRNPNQ